MVLPIFFKGFTMVLPTPLVLDLFSCNGPEPAHGIFFFCTVTFFSHLSITSAQGTPKNQTHILK